MTTSFSHTGSLQQWTVPTTGWWRVTVWGAAGGNFIAYPGTQGEFGGVGGAVAGSVVLTAGTVVDIWVGGRGKDSGTPGNGAGGWSLTGFTGGACGSPVPQAGHAGGGGGATVVELPSGLLVVAGAGGGAGLRTSSYFGHEAYGQAGGRPASGLGDGPGAPSVTGGGGSNSTAGAGGAGHPGSGPGGDGHAGSSGTGGQGGFWAGNSAGGGGGGGALGGGGGGTGGQGGGGGGGGTWWHASMTDIDDPGPAPGADGDITLDYLGPWVPPTVGPPRAHLGLVAVTR